MPTLEVLALGIVFLVGSLLILSARGKAVGPDGPDPDLQDAWTLIGHQVDDHIEQLAHRYQAWLDGNVAPGTPGGFSQEIELFIGDVLLRSADGAELWLKEAVREILVLERDEVHDQILRRVQAHLRQPADETMR